MLATNGAFADRVDAGNVGLGVLRNFVATFDLGNAAMYLTPGSGFDDGRRRTARSLGNNFAMRAPRARVRSGRRHRPNMQHTTGVAVVATHLAHTDRRALSQAWYSALHLADRPPAARQRAARAARRARRRRGPRCARDPRRRAAAPCGGRRALARAARARDASARRDGAARAERRAPKTELARRIERGLTRRAAARRGGSFAVRGADGRVQLIVRSDGARTRVVAVCAPPLRERVERALAHARFALAGCGVRAEVA